MVFAALLPLSAALVMQVSVGVRVGSAAAGDSARKANEAARRARRDMVYEDSGSRRPRREGRRIALTDELRASAFQDATAKSLLLRARMVRLPADSDLAALYGGLVLRLEGQARFLGDGQGVHVAPHGHDGAGLAALERR